MGTFPKVPPLFQRRGTVPIQEVVPWGMFPNYERISEEDFRIVSAGKDKVFNTEDDIVLKF